MKMAVCRRRRSKAKSWRESGNNVMPLIGGNGMAISVK
jgi:hypothetical protein